MKCIQYFPRPQKFTTIKVFEFPEKYCKIKVYFDNRETAKTFLRNHQTKIDQRQMKLFFDQVTSQIKFLNEFKEKLAS